MIQSVQVELGSGKGSSWLEPTRTEPIRALILTDWLKVPRSCTPPPTKGHCLWTDGAPSVWRTNEVSPHWTLWKERRKAYASLCWALSPPPPPSGIWIAWRELRFWRPCLQGFQFIVAMSHIITVASWIQNFTDRQFSCQLAIMLCLRLYVGQAKNRFSSLSQWTKVTWLSEEQKSLQRLPFCANTMALGWVNV